MQNYAMKWFALLLVCSGLAVTSASAQEPPRVAVKGTVLAREPTDNAWVLELDRAIEFAPGRMVTVRLLWDDRRDPAHPLHIGDRLAVEGRLLAPALTAIPSVGDTLASLDPERIEHLSDPGLRHAYFLFGMGRSEGCAECYIPLLLTTDPIGPLATVPDAEVIVTFERDSIWEIRTDQTNITEVEPHARTLRLDGRPYRYQEVPLQEPIRLLTNPLGTIPISRPGPSGGLAVPAETHRKALLLRLGVRPP